MKLIDRKLLANVGKGMRQLLSALVLLTLSEPLSAQDNYTYHMYGEPIFTETFGQGVGIWDSFEAAGISTLAKKGIYVGYGDYQLQHPNDRDNNYMNPNGYPYYPAPNYDVLADFDYRDFTITNELNNLRGAYGNHKTWVLANFRDHTGDKNGRMFVADGASIPGVVFERRVTELCKNADFEFSAWVSHFTYNVQSPGEFQLEVWTKNPELGLEEEFEGKSESEQVRFMRNIAIGTRVKSGDGGTAELLAKKFMQPNTYFPIGKDTTLHANDDMYVYEYSAGECVPYKVFYADPSHGGDGSFYCQGPDGTLYHANHDRTPATNTSGSARGGTYYDAAGNAVRVNGYAMPYYQTHEYFTKGALVSSLSLNPTGMVTSGGWVLYREGGGTFVYHDESNGKWYRWDGELSYATMVNQSRTDATQYRCLRFGATQYSVNNAVNYVSEYGSGYNFSQSITSLYRILDIGDEAIFAARMTDGKVIYFKTTDFGDINYSSTRYRGYNYRYNFRNLSTAYQVQPSVTETNITELQNFGTVPGLTSSFDYHADAMIQRHWEQVVGHFRLTTQDNVYLVFRNFRPDKNGNDFCVDDIQFRPFAAFSLDIELSPSSEYTACRYGFVTMRTVVQAVEEELELLGEDVRDYGFYFEGWDGSDWITLNSKPIQIQSITDPIEINLPLSEYYLYEKIRTVIRAVSNLNGKCMAISSDEYPRHDFLNAPLFVLKGDDICIEEGDSESNPHQGHFTFTNTHSRAKTEAWRAKGILSDGTVVDIMPRTANDCPPSP